MTVRTCLFSCICIFVLGACAAPTVQYSMLQDKHPNPQGKQKFQFAHSALSLSQASSGSYTITAVLLDSPVDPYYTAYGSSMAWGVTTHIGFKYKANSNLLDTADVSVEDNRIKYIDAAGSILGTVAGAVVAGGGPAPQNTAKLSGFPTSLPLDPYLSTLTPDACHDEEQYRSCVYEQSASNGVQKWQVALHIYPPPPDAIPLADFQKNHLGTNEPSLYYSTCREANVTISLIGNAPPPVAAAAPKVAGGAGKIVAPIAPITVGDSEPGQKAAAAVRIADPNYVEGIALPDKGTVTFRNDCGAEISSQAAGTSSGIEVTAEVFKEMKSVYDSSQTKAAATKTAAGSK